MRGSRCASPPTGWTSRATSPTPGATALGHYNVSSFNAEANGEATAAFAEDFKAKTGQYPVFVQGHTVHGIWGLGEALKTLKPGPDGKLSVKQLAFAMEKVRFDTSMGEIAMRAEDHQALLPLVVSVVSKDAKYKVDGTDMGFKPVAPHLWQGSGRPGAAVLQDGASASLLTKCGSLTG